MKLGKQLFMLHRLEEVKIQFLDFEFTNPLLGRYEQRTLGCGCPAKIKVKENSRVMCAQQKNFIPA